MFCALVPVMYQFVRARVYMCVCVCVTCYRIDLGTCDELALDALINCLAGFSRDVLGLKQVVIGGQNRDWPVPETGDREGDEEEVRTHTHTHAHAHTLSLTHTRAGMRAYAFFFSPQ